MPPNTVKVDRTTRWGNPFTVGAHGTRIDVVKYFALGICGLDVLGYKTGDGRWTIDVMREYRGMAKRDRRFLHGKNLACWCPLDKPCHADILLHVAANYGRKRRKRLDIEGYLNKFGGSLDARRK